MVRHRALARALLHIIAGPNEGDTLSIDAGACRLLGRHLSDTETVFIDRAGHRVLDQAAVRIVADSLNNASKPSLPFSVNAFERGADIIIGDESISRAHAMVFVDPSGVGIIDLASTNGTYVNDARVGVSFVKDGDVVRLGESVVTISIQKPTAAEGD